MATIDSKIPEGALAEKWTNYKAIYNLVIYNLNLASAAQ